MFMPKCWFCLWSGLALAGLIAVVPSNLHAGNAGPEDASAPAAEVAEPPAEEAATTDEAQPAGAAQQEDVKVQGRIIVVGPDGERREFSFGRDFPHPAFHVRPPRMFRVGPDGSMHDPGFGTDPHAAAHQPGYVIGLDAAPADETLRAQLELGEAGLTVRSVVEGGPAAAAGLQPHDVLIRIGDEELTSLAALVKAVHDSEGQPLTITFLRAGEEQTVELTPIERKVTVRPASVDDPMQLRNWIEQRIDGPAEFQARMPDFHVQAVHPGVVIQTHPGPSHRLDELVEQIGRLNDQVADLQEAVEDLKERQE